MSAPCDDAFRATADTLGGISCERADPIGTLRSPGGLENWTLPVVETVMIGGALLALAFAFRLWRRTGNPAWLGLWCAAVVYALVLEPPLYFPEQFGFGDHLDVIFVHNVFTVQFLYDRMPLYIVALYPAMIFLSCVVVAALGVFERSGAPVAALSVGFVHHCFYEVFDHLGPQLRWWAWNPEAATNRPALGSVPLSSVILFGLVGPALLALLWRLLVAEPAGSGRARGGRTVLRTVGVGVLTPALLPVAGVPLSYLTLVEHPNRTVMAAVLYAAVAAAAVVTVPVLAGRGARSARSDGRVSPARSAAPSEGPGRGEGLLGAYAVGHGVVYLAVFLGLWLVALPDVVTARGGMTDDGAPVGNPVYAAVCAVVCGWLLVRVARRGGGPVPDCALRRGSAGRAWR
ncbi:hypothetical protein MXD62_03805 [Frankia sp. Mgl5]|uniref:hypothetical protein n=1 Tax=Frankia sp. Mgl5 TaxID=2933793 RepID=UPI00200DA1F8|nr:hypothetical protein [Frankia sp. Mgl5]MCK9926300.1 hypothetical protein [Frankia sp. Mgl5]